MINEILQWMILVLLLVFQIRVVQDVILALSEAILALLLSADAEPCEKCLQPVCVCEK